MRHPFPTFTPLASLLILVAGISLFACSHPQRNLFLMGPALKGFKPAGPLVVYNKRTLYDYIDGEADVYLPLGFRLLYTQSYRNEQTDAQMISEAYDMGTPEGAASVFSKFAEGPGSRLPRLGEAGWTGSGMILFHRDRYYLKVYADPSPEQEVRPGSEELIGLSFLIDEAIQQ